MGKKRVIHRLEAHNICCTKRQSEDLHRTGDMWKGDHTSTKKRPLRPIHRQQRTSPQTNTLREIDTPPQVHSHQPTTKV